MCPAIAWKTTGTPAGNFGRGMGTVRPPPARVSKAKTGELTNYLLTSDRLSGPLKCAAAFRGKDGCAKLMIKHLKGVASGFLLGWTVFDAQAAYFVIGSWDFNTADGDGTTGTLFTDDGNGQLDPVGNGQLGFAYSNGSSDLSTENSVLQLVAPAGTAAGNPIGADFGISTLGFQSVQVTFDFDHPPISTAAFQFRLSTDNGTTWSETATLLPSGDGFWTHSYTVDLSSQLEAGNNFNLRFQFLGSLTTDAIIDTAAFELDMVRVSGEASPVPEPTAVVMSLGLVALAAARRFGRR